MTNVIPVRPRGMGGPAKEGFQAGLTRPLARPFLSVSHR